MGIRILLDLGSLYYEQEIWEKAENTFRKINTHYLRQHHQLNLLALTANNLGCSLWRQGKGQQADEILRYSAGIYETLADKLMWANVTHILGSIALEQGRFSIAQHAYNEAEKIASDYSDNFFAQNILKNIADFRAQLPTQKSRK
jgi:tetratricopeptide (TPR) repeat protein